MDLALEKWGELQAKLQKASQYRDKGGIPLVWTPAGSTKTLTFYVLLGEITEIPITATGDLAGWFFNSPTIQVKLTCRPFGYRAERTILVEKTSSAPLQEQVIEGVEGDVPAEGRLIVTEKSGIDRRHMEWGLDQNSGTLLLTAAALPVAGFSGTLTTHSGAYASEKVIRAIAVGSAIPMCGTGNLSNVGSYRVKARIFPTSESARFGISYKVGDGPLKSLSFVEAPGVNEWFEIDLGEVSLDEVEMGTQRSEIRLEQRSAGASCENDANYLVLVPTTSGYGKARGLASGLVSNLVALDEANQEPGGALTGGYATNGITAITAANPGVITSTSHGLANGDKIWVEGVVGTMGEVLTGLFTVAGVTTNTFNVGVNTTGKAYTSGGKISKGGKTLLFPNTARWHGVGDQDDATVNATAHTFERSALSDTGLTSGRYLIIGGSSSASIRFGVDSSASVASLLENYRRGSFIRYRDANNWLMAVLTTRHSGMSGPINFGLLVLMSVGGVISELAKPSPVGNNSQSDQLVSYRVELQADNTGLWRAWAGPAGSSNLSLIASGQDPNLATGGPLASGWYGYYDAWTSATACTRTFDKVAVSASSEAGRVCYASKKLEIRADTTERQDATGTYYGPPTSYRGARFYVPTGSSRLALKLRRNDVDSEPDAAVTDSQGTEVKIAERFLAPR